MQSHRIIAAAAAITLAATPAALAKKPADAGAKGKEKSELKSQKAKGKGKGKSKAKNAVAHGTITAIAGDAVTIAVTKANKHGRTSPTLTITVEKVSVADVNGDGSSSLADFAVGDSVVAHSKGGKLISVTNPEPEEAEETEEPAPAPVTDAAPTA